MSPRTHETTVLDVAFGAHPSRLADAVTSPPRSLTGVDAWSTAVALGAVGHYGRALTELQRVRAAPGLRSGVIASLIASTRASHLRQTGQHRRARRFDGVALSLATGAPPGPATQAATTDALVGLAADHLGLGLLGVSERLLDRAETVGVPHREGETVENWVWTDRPRLRVAWVRTELSLYRGDPAAARSTAEQALDLASGCPSVRHVIKTDLIVAAARAADGAGTVAVDSALDCARRAREHTLDPLLWAASALLLGVQDHLDESTASAVRAEEDTVRRRLDLRGGAFAAP